MHKAKKLAVKFGEGVAITAILAGQALAAPTELTKGSESARPTGASGELFGAGGIFQRIADILIFIVGAVAVIMLIIGGLRYVVSGGNKDGVEGAKNTILYAIIGIVVAALAFAAVRFIVGRV